MKIDHYKLICELVERGIEMGWQQAHKYNDNPSEQKLKDDIHSQVMTEICEYYRFDE